MKIQRVFWVVALFVAVALAFSGFQGVFAGTTGKISGRVVDAVKKEPLGGVTVALEGTRRGAVTQPDGYYFILSADPGSYRLVASLVGYDKVAQQEVRVVADYTTTVNFNLKETAVQMSEVVVTAERPPVEPDKTDSKYVMSKQEIQALPMTRSLTDLVALQPGVYQNDATVIRGGDSQDAAFYVDGVRLINNDVNGSTASGSPPTAFRQFSGINKSAIQELVVISGGAGAEYGNLVSGVVSVVTRDGSQEFHGWADMRYTPPGQKHWGANAYDSPYHRGKVKWDDRGWTSETVTLSPGLDGKVGTGDDLTGLAHLRTPYTDEKGYYAEAGMSGPLSKRSSFLFTGKWSQSPYAFPNATLHTPPNFYGNLKLSFDVTNNFRLKVGQIYGYQEIYRMDPNNSVTGTGIPNAYRDLASNGIDLFLPAGSGAGKSKIIDNVTYATITHTISPKTFYEVRVSRYRSTEDTVNVPAASYKFGLPISALPKKDLDGWFNAVPATVVDINQKVQNRWEFRADLSSQVTRGHFLKAGAEAILYNLSFYRYFSPNPGSRTVSYITQAGNLPNVQKPINPYQMAFYAQDKMEFEGLIMNVGVRFDAFFTNTRAYNSSILQSPQYRWLIFHKDMPTYPGSHTSVISPRLGVSHPITSRSAFHFTAGIYTRMPDLIDLFAETWNTSSPDDHVAFDGFRGIRSQQALMNAFQVQYERTRAFEAGTDWNFVSDFTAGISAYYKSAIGKVGTGSRYWFEPQGTTYVWGRKPSSYQDLKGIEVSLRKKFSHMFSFNAALNFGWANAGSIGSNATFFAPDSGYVASDATYYDWQWDNASGHYVKLFFSAADKARLGHIAQDLLRTNVYYDTPARAAMEINWFQSLDAQKSYGAPQGIVAAWQPAYGGTLYAPKGVDRHTMANITLYFQSPKDFGPGVRGFNPIGDMRANLVYRVQTGTNVSYTPPGKQSEFRWKPIEAKVDMQVEKTLMGGSKGRDIVFYIEVFNLFNQRDSSIPFNYPDYVQWGLNQPRPDDANFQQYGDYNELSRYIGAPRQINLGARINF